MLRASSTRAQFLTGRVAIPEREPYSTGTGRNSYSCIEIMIRMIEILYCTAEYVYEDLFSNSVGRLGEV